MKIFVSGLSKNMNSKKTPTVEPVFRLFTFRKGFKYLIMKVYTVST